MSLKTAGIREFARMIGRSHSWVVSQCQRNIIPKTTDGKIPVDDALKIVAQLDEEKSRSQRDVEAVLEQMFNELLEKIHGGQFSADEEVKDGDLE